jgi:hypothetical protein
MQRGIVPPLLVLETNRGGLSARRQREAEGQILRLRDALAIGRRFLPNLSPNTRQAVAELVALVQTQSVPEDRKWLESFSELSTDQTEQLATSAAHAPSTELTLQGPS